MAKTGARAFHGVQADACGYHAQPIAVRASSYLGDATGTYAYKAAQSWLHWAMAAGVITVVATVKISQNSTAEQRKRWGVSRPWLMVCLPRNRTRLVSG